MLSSAMSFGRLAAVVVLLAVSSQALRAADPVKKLFVPGETFLVQGRPSFILWPAKEKRTRPQPWIYYCPTLPTFPNEHDVWMQQRLLAAGVAVAGIDIGEQYGAPIGNQYLTLFYKEMTEKRGLAAKPCMMGVSRGGLWMTSWTENHPEWVSGMAGIYPCLDLRSYPGLAVAAPAYKMTAAQLEVRLKEFNPIERAGALARNKIPIFIIHGDADRVTPLAANAGRLARIYEAAGVRDQMQLVVAEGQAHDYWEGFYQSQELVDFAVARAKAGAQAAP